VRSQRALAGACSEKALLPCRKAVLSKASAGEGRGLVASLMSEQTRRTDSCALSYHPDMTAFSISPMLVIVNSMNPPLTYVCNYGPTNLNDKKLTLDSEKITVSNAGDGNSVLEVPFSMIKTATFSANYLQLDTGSEKHTIRGIKPLDYNPALSRYSLSEPASLKAIEEHITAMGVAISRKAFVMDKNVIIALVSIVVLMFFLFLNIAS
jgi:hypothetical protein